MDVSYVIPDRSEESPNSIAGLASAGLSADRPIETRSDDRLGRSTFAEGLRNAVIGWKGNDSLVIALFGPWGTGKTSAKNLMLEGVGPDQMLVLEFNPWFWSGNQRLTSAFFRELGRTLGLDNPEANKELAAKLRYYGAILGGATKSQAGATRRLSAAISIFASLAVGQSFLTNPVVADINRGLLILLALVSGVVAIFGAVADYVASVYEAKDKSESKSALDLKKQIAEELRKLSKPVLVVIDDLDRLVPSELRVVARLVKSNADLPNIVFLLLADRRVVGKALSREGIDGFDYLEKIVQVPFDLPVADQTQVDQALFERLNHILQRPGVDSNFSQSRWGNLYLETLRPYFGSLRRVNRFISTFEFQASRFQSATSFEVNVIDLIVLEVLRVFEPEVYLRLPALKQVLTHRSTEEGGLRGMALEDAKALLDDLVACAPTARRERVKEIVKELFPHANEVWGGSGYSDFEDKWLREMRVCSEDRFDRYFQLGIPKGDVPQAIIDSIIEHGGQRERTRSALEDLDRRGLLAKALDLLDSYKETISPAIVVPFCTAIFDIGDRLLPGRTFLEMGSDMHAVRIVRWALKGIGQVEAREAALMQAVTETTGLYLPIMRVKLEEDFYRERKDEALVRPESVAVLKQICVQKIQQVASSQALLSSPQLPYILWRWHQWAGPEPVKEWLLSQIRAPFGALAVLRRFVHRQRESLSGDRVERTIWTLSIRELDPLVPLESFEDALKSLTNLDMSGDDGEVLKAFDEALARKRAGETDDPFGDTDSADLSKPAG